MAVTYATAKIASVGQDPVELVYRLETRDWPTIKEVFEKHPYRLSNSRVAQRTFIDDAYQAIVDRGTTPLILDAGANIGASAVFLARLYPQARIVAVEPEPSNFALLQRNVAAWPQVTTVHGALAGADGELTLFDPGRSTDAFRAAKDDNGGWHGRAIGSVRAWSMASLIEEFGQGCEPLLAKIDIEGGEADLFAGDTAWVDAFPAIAIELHDWMLPGQAVSAPFLRCVGERGRDFVCIPGIETVYSLRNPQPQPS